MAKEKEIIIDGEMSVLGRMASFAAKQALLGNKVVVLNCDKVIIIGTPRDIVARYQHRRSRGKSSQKGPYISKEPSLVVKRTVRGMLQYKKAQGSKAFKRVICYNDAPKEYEKYDKNKISFKKDASKFITLSKLASLV